jgi:hypothetical protein
MDYLCSILCTLYSHFVWALHGLWTIGMDYLVYFVHCTVTLKYISNLIEEQKYRTSIPISTVPRARSRLIIVVLYSKSSRKYHDGKQQNN